MRWVQSFPKTSICGPCLQSPFILAWMNVMEFNCFYCYTFRYLNFPTKSWHSMVTSVIKICPVQGSLLWVMVQEAILQTRACLCWICRSSLFISQYASSVLLLDIESQSPACASFCHFCFSFRKTWASARTGFNKGWFSFGTYRFICGLMTLQHRKLML